MRGTQQGCVERAVSVMIVRGMSVEDADLEMEAWRCHLALEREC